MIILHLKKILLKYINSSYSRQNSLKEILASPLLLIWPFMSFLLALNNPLGKCNRIIFFLFWFNRFSIIENDKLINDNNHLLKIIRKKDV